MDFNFNYKKKKIELEVKILKNVFSQALGLMFKKNSPVLLFYFSRFTRQPIHSFFCVPFVAVWFSENKIVDVKIIKKWRMNIFLRDNFTCQFCGARGIYLEAHHVKSWAQYPKLRFVEENGITLCKDCHELTKNYKNHKN